MGTTRQQWQRVRKLTLVPRTGESAIADFLRWATTEELWTLTPPMARVLPEKLKEDYGWICSPHGLDVSYDRVPDNIRPMLQLLLRRWQLTEPAKVAHVVAVWKAFILRRRWLLPQLEAARERGLAEGELLALFNRLCADYARMNRRLKVVGVAISQNLCR